jgi:3-deoxy-manno-octulosonate cytidylyltransferase (CMP-KDO synthetase)
MDAGAPQSTNDLAIIVPARLESTRFPRKLLHPIAGKPLLLHVADRLREQVPEFPLCFAVDHESLADVLEGEGIRFLMTSASHTSGTDRLAEANRAVGARYVINVQADEPLITREQVLTLAELVRENCDMATLGTPFSNPENFSNPNQVKVVTDLSKRALYFSRSPIPFARDLAGKVSPAWLAENRVLRHLGLYAYRAEFLDTFSSLQPSPLEQVEKLEQLRALENGYCIRVGTTDKPTIGIDTPEDAAAYEAWLAKEPNG